MGRKNTRGIKKAVYDRFEDRTVKSQCPDCNKTWDREY